MSGDWYSPAQLAMPVVGFLHMCGGYPDGQCHCFHPWAFINERPVPDHVCPEPLIAGGITMTDDQVQTPKPGEPEPAPPVEETEPALEDADTTTTTTTTETTTEDSA